MKIASIIENEILAGGGFSMSVSSLIRFDRLCKKNSYEHIIYTNRKKNIEILKKLGIECDYITISWLDKIFMWISQSLIFLFLQTYLKMISPFEKKFIKNKIDIINFVTTSPTPCLLQKLNFIFTVYDVCHIDHPEFSEVREFGTLYKRDFLLKKILPAASIIVTESDELKIKLQKYYNINIHKVTSILNEPSNLLNNVKIEKNFENFFLKKNNLKLNNFYFYPAQYWEHKNHILILKTFKNLINKKKFSSLKIVFCGSDKGNLSFIKKKISDFKLENNITVLNFVQNDELFILYKNCKAIIMPSFFGPTNIPPLDAWQFGKTVFYGKHLDSETQEGPIYFDVFDQQVLEKKIIEFENNHNLATKYSNLGQMQLKKILIKRERGYSDLEKKLQEFSTKLECWK
jgi:glycosyltransferase involved in cell wall biosynthesis